MNPQVLVAENDLPLANLLRRQLQAESYKVDLAYDGESAFAAANDGKYHLFVLSLDLPKLDGVSLLRQLKPKQPIMPILALSGTTQVEDRILSLDSGADDCLTKPFFISELMARARALLRRNPNAPGHHLRVGDLTLDSREFRVERSGKKITLSGKEFALLEYLMRNARQTVSRTMIMEQVWKITSGPTTNLVDVYVKYVRDKVDADEFSPKLIRTVRGVGYVLSDS
jgi:DNA-binding response OmpR family regulator